MGTLIFIFLSADTLLNYGLIVKFECTIKSCGILKSIKLSIKPRNLLVHGKRVFVPASEDTIILLK